MESLLSLAFDNLSSKDNNHLRKGLKQIEGLLAQLCLPSSILASPNKRRPSALPLSGPACPKAKPLAELNSDPAFTEFSRLQESFEWNGKIHISLPVAELQCNSWLTQFPQ